MKKNKNTDSLERESAQDESQMLPIRFPKELIALLDREVERLREEAPFNKGINRSQLIRDAVYRCYGTKREAPARKVSSVKAISEATPIEPLVPKEIQTKPAPRVALPKPAPKETKPEPSPQPDLALVSKETSSPKSEDGKCRICGETLPPGRTGLCTRNLCLREDKKRKERNEAQQETVEPKEPPHISPLELPSRASESSPLSEHPIPGGKCRVCARAIPEGKTLLCGRAQCVKKDTLRQARSKTLL